MLSVHIADIGPRRALRALRLRPSPAKVSGLRYAETLLAAPLRSGTVVGPQPGRVALLAAWHDDDALDGFLAEHPLARLLEPGWQVRLEPLRSRGAWSPLPDLPGVEPVGESDPVAVLTLGRLRLSRLPAFLATSAKAERTAVTHPALLAGTALARPPRIVATFSLWRTTREMREYAVGQRPGAHRAAIDAHVAHAFHDESVFVRFRPYSARGTWGAAGSALDARPAAARPEGEHTRLAGTPPLARRTP